MEYDFSKINDEEYEELFKDILKSTTGENFRTFAKGRDGGIDVISTNAKNKIIGQAKHYVKTPMTKLLKDLKNKEKPKVTRLNPDRYIVAFSQEITSQAYEKILEIFSPFLKDGNDIYDLKRMKEILDNDEKLINKWYKLWLPSKEIIDKILKNSENAITSFYKEKIDKEVQLFIETKYYKEAIKTLEKENVIIIHGNPGTGKTTLANILVYQFLARDYKLKYIMNSELSNINNLINIDEKEIILIDDFLGSNILELEAGKETALATLINLCRFKKNKKLILVTRTVLYNRAKNTYEKFNEVDNKICNLMIDTSRINILERAKILYNHLSFYGINSTEKYEAFIKNKLYLKIIRSHNFNPRIVAEIVENAALRLDNNDEIVQMIDDSLSNPNSIWEYYYKNLNAEEKIILKLIAIFNREINMDILKDVFDGIYHKIAKKYNLSIKENCFLESIRTLSGSLVRIVNREDSKMINLANPSIRDYIIDIFSKNEYNLITDYIDTNLYIEQLLFLYQITNQKAQNAIKEIILQNYFWLNCIEDKEEKIFNFLVSNKINNKLTKKIFKKFFIDRQLRIRYQTMQNILYLVKEEEAYYKRVFITYEYKKQINNIIDNINYRDNLEEYLDISDSIFEFNFEYYVDIILPNIESAINRCYENELNENADMILDEFVGVNLRDKKKIEEKLSDIYWQKAEDFFDYLAYDVCKKVKTESKIRELHDMGEIDYNSVYEYWHDIMDDMDEEERETHKSNAELIREIFEKN
ncbi:aAA ATPase [Clostridium sp. CAG:575]|nr:aAA ATPase [Clostridium sp. CAG:575]